MKKRTALLAFLLALTLTGCFFRGADELYTVPRPSKDYEALQVRLSEFIAKGGEYAAPLSGELIQSVQLQDLDGDGIQEAIAFFRFPNEEKPMKICVFHQTEMCIRDSGRGLRDAHRYRRSGHRHQLCGICPDG